MVLEVNDWLSACPYLRLSSLIILLCQVTIILIRVITQPSFMKYLLKNFLFFIITAT